MRDCPACCEPMNPVEVKSSAFDACPRCGGFFFDAAALGSIVPAPALQAALATAKGRAGKCRGCASPLSSAGPCPKCARPAPACPDCGQAPLRIGNVKGVNLDVCLGCGGLFFDAGELQLVAGWGAQVQALQQAAYRIAQDSDDPRAPVSCSECERRVMRKDAFSLDDRLYCARCCPAGAAPLTLESRRESTVADPARYAHMANAGLVGGGEGFALFALLGRLFR